MPLGCASSPPPRAGFHRARRVAQAGLPGIASGDFHQLEHLATWKTLLPCARTERAVVDYLRSDLPSYLVDFAEPAHIEAAA